MIRVIFLSVLFATWCEARIGDTLEECEARYGEPIEVKEVNERYRGALSGRHLFEFDGLNISAQFDKDGRCVYVTYSNRVEEPRAGLRKLSREQCERLLKLNGAGQQWTPREGKSDVRDGEHVKQTTIVEAWERKDGQVLAWYKEMKAAKKKGRPMIRYSMSVFGCRTADFDALLQELNRKAVPKPGAD